MCGPSSVSDSATPSASDGASTCPARPTRSYSTACNTSFPNFAPWIAYRFRPWGNDPDFSLMEIILLHPIPDDGVYQTAAEHWLEIGESWTHAPGFDLLGMVIDQDIDNLPKVQKGLKNASHTSIVLGDYQEIRIRHFHQRLDVQLGLA